MSQQGRRRRRHPHGSAERPASGVPDRLGDYYLDSSAPVGKLTTFRVLLAEAAHLDYGNRPSDCDSPPRFRASPFGWLPVLRVSASRVRGLVASRTHQMGSLGISSGANVQH